MKVLVQKDNQAVSVEEPRPSLNAQIPLFSAREAPDAFRKAVQVLHSKPKAPLSLLQRKLGNAWLKHAIETPPDPDGWWELSIKSLAQSIGFDSHNRQYLKESAEALMTIVFEWDVIAPSNKRIHWKASVLFPEIEIRSDVVRYQLSSQMRERMINPDIYALIDMSVVRRFRRAPSLAIWEFCIRFEKIGRTAEVPWTQFRDMVLGEMADSTTYQEYKYFKSKVLNPAMAEINAESNHLVSLQEAKVGKRVSSLRFEVAKKQEALPLNPPVALELLGAMVELGVPQSEARKLMGQHSDEAIRAALAYTHERRHDTRQRKLEHPAAYFRQALLQGYAQARATSGGAEEPCPIMDLRQAYAQEQLVHAEGYFKELDASDQAQLVERYNTQQPTRQLQVKKRVTALSRAAFLRWLVQQTWGEPSNEELLAFAQKMLSRRAATPASHERSPVKGAPDLFVTPPAVAS